VVAARPPGPGGGDGHFSGPAALDADGPRGVLRLRKTAGDPPPATPHGPVPPGRRPPSVGETSSGPSGGGDHRAGSTGVRPRRRPSQPGAAGPGTRFQSGDRRVGVTGNGRLSSPPAPGGPTGYLGPADVRRILQITARPIARRPPSSARASAHSTTRGECGSGSPRWALPGQPRRRGRAGSSTSRQAGTRQPRVLAGLPHPAPTRNGVVRRDIPLFKQRGQATRSARRSG